MVQRPERIAARYPRRPHPVSRDVRVHLTNWSGNYVAGDQTACLAKWSFRSCQRATRRTLTRRNYRHDGDLGLNMPFTNEEKRLWHEQKKKRENRPTPVFRSEPVAVCVHCQNPFGTNEGAITTEVALCDVCNGD